MATPASDLSVVIPTCNRREVLRRTLDALARQTLDPERFEVIVVDDGSTDGTDAMVRSLATSFPLRYEHAPNAGLAAARNRGLRHASRSVVVFLDDDVIPVEGFLEAHHHAHLEAPDVVVLGSLPFHPEVARSTFLWYLDRVTFFDLFKDPRKYRGSAPPMPPLNGNSSVRRIHLERIGGYDESFRAYGGEDLDLGYRLRRAGLRFVYRPDAVGYHYHVKGFDAFCRDQERAGHAVARLAERYPEIRKAKRVNLVADPWSALRGRERLQRIGLDLLIRCPLPVSLAGLAVRVLGRSYRLRRVLVPLYRLGSHYHYAVGMRNYLREPTRGTGAPPDVPLVPRPGPADKEPFSAARD